MTDKPAMNSATARLYRRQLKTWLLDPANANCPARPSFVHCHNAMLALEKEANGLWDRLISDEGSFA